MNANYLEKEFYHYVKTDENLFNGLKGNIYDGLCCWDLKNIKNYWTNGFFWSFFGSDSLEINNVVETLQKIIFKEDFIIAKEKFKKHLRDISSPLEQILRLKHKNGSTLWIHCYGKAFRNEEGDLHIFIGMFQDITGKSQLQQDLMEARCKVQNIEQQFKFLFEYMEQGLALQKIICNEKGVPVDLELIRVNKSFAKALGISQMDCVGKSLKELAPGFDFGSIEKLNDVAQHRKRIHYDYHFKERDRYFEILTYSPEKEYLVTVISDVTQSRDSQNRLVAEKEKAEKENLLKTTFLANMSHEIRTPLNAIIGFASFLKELSCSREDMDKYVEIIINGGNHLLNLINDIVDISKIDAGQLILKEGEIDLNMFLQEMYNFFHSNLVSLGKTNISLKMDIPKESPVIISDETRLRQILINLLGNAVKFTHKGVVEFGYKLEKGELVFFVRDTGIGIPKEKQEIIFERFQQGGNLIEQVYGGTGLGLAIVKACVQMLNGRIWLKSVPEKGTTFYFTIKSKIIQKEAEQKNNVDYLDIDFQGKSILIAEDDNFNFEYLKAILSRCNLKIIRTDNGFDTITQVKENDQIELVLMDIQMPGMSGDFATQEIRKTNIKIPIIAQTASALLKDKEKFLKIGCNDYITKPVRKELLLETIKQYL